MTLYGFLGDTHANAAWTEYAIDFFERNGITTVLQVGDFGVYPSKQFGQEFLRRVQHDAKEAGITIYVTRGNHENHDAINELEDRGDGWLYLRDNIAVAPMVHRWEWDGLSFLSLGGAPSVDRTFQQKRGNWYASEMITPEHVAEAVEGGYADFMVAHDAPIIPEIDDMIKDNPHGFLEADLAYADEGRKLMHKAAHGVKPKFFVHGHYHFPVNAVKLWSSVDTGHFGTRDIVGNTRVIGLNKDLANFAFGIFDTETQEFTVPDIFMDYNTYRFGTEYKSKGSLK